MYVLGARVVCRCLAEGDGTQVVLANRHWLRQVLRIEVLQQLLSVGALVLWSFHLARRAPTRLASGKWEVGLCVDEHHATGPPKS